jgi:hypothetical protein
MASRSEYRVSPQMMAVSDEDEASLTTLQFLQAVA